MKRNILVAILLLAIFTYSCTIKEEPLQDSLSPMSDLALVDDGSIVDEPIVLVEGFIPDKEDFPDTKTALSFDNSGAKFTFVNGDRLGIFPYTEGSSATQMPFELKSSDASSAVFNCPGFSLTAGTGYAAYYPYNSSTPSYSSVAVDYTSQWQPSATTPAASTSANFNISSADYLLAQATPSGNACSFKMSHIGALVVMDVTVVTGATYTELSLNSSSASFTQTGTLNVGQSYTPGTSSNPTQGIKITSTSTANKMTLKLGSSTGSGIRLEAGTYRFCMMVPPTNVTGTVTIRLKDNSNVEHIAYVGTKNLRQGYAYRYSCTLDAITSLYDTIIYDGFQRSTANCYIVTTGAIDPDGYYFPTHIAGNGISPGWSDIGFTDNANEAYPAGGGASLSGNGVEVILNQNSCVSDVFFSSNRIYFKASGAKGNAKLTLTNNGTRVWTWHIWCTDQPGTATVNGYTVMDRNMGALKNGVEDPQSDDVEQMTGFYYPFGYPFGFTVAEYKNGDVYCDRMIDAFGLNPHKPMLRLNNSQYYPFNPNRASNANAVWERLWRRPSNGGKTMYDPCPAGFKVTPKDFWDNIGTMTGDYYGIYKNSIRFPVNGRVFQEGWQYLNIDIGGTTYTNQKTIIHRVYMWTVNTYNDNAYHFYAEKGNPNGHVVTTDVLTRGMGVRCVKE